MPTHGTCYIGGHTIGQNKKRRVLRYHHVVTEDPRAISEQVVPSLIE